MPEGTYPRGVVRRGPAVKEVQDRPEACGVDPEPIDGEFGPLTQGPVKDFQEWHGGPDRRPLVPDGVVGPLTWSALFGEVVSDAGLGEPAEVMAGTKTIPPGDFVHTTLRWRDRHGRVGLVETVDGLYVHTIEGNASNKARRRQHELSDLAGFARLRWTCRRAGRAKPRRRGLAGGSIEVAVARPSKLPPGGGT